jgi:hypothetical protein
LATKAASFIRFFFMLISIASSRNGIGIVLLSALADNLPPFGIERRMTHSRARHPDGNTGAAPLISASAAAPTNSHTKLSAPSGFVVTASRSPWREGFGVVTNHKPARPAPLGIRRPAARHRAAAVRELNLLHPLPAGSLPSRFALEPIYFPHAPINIRALLLQCLFLMIASLIFLSGAIFVCLFDLHH